MYLTIKSQTAFFLCLHANISNYWRCYVFCTVCFFFHSCECDISRTTWGNFLISDELIRLWWPQVKGKYPSYLLSKECHFLKIWHSKFVTQISVCSKQMWQLLSNKKIIQPVSQFHGKLGWLSRCKHCKLGTDFAMCLNSNSMSVCGA